LESKANIEPTSTWDAGATGCGELIVLLRARVLALETGQVLRVIAERKRSVLAGARRSLLGHERTS
jgi:hypothetical protein